MDSRVEKTHTAHASSRSLFSLLNITPFERFHLSVLLSQHGLCRPWTRIPHSHLRWHALWSRWLKWGMTWMGGMRLIRNPLHWTRPRTRVRRKLLTGSTRSSGHSTSHTARHTTGDSTWDVTLHTRRNPSRYTSGDISDWRASSCTMHNLLSCFLSSDIDRRKVGRLEGVRTSGLIEYRIHGCSAIKMERIRITGRKILRGGQFLDGEENLRTAWPLL